MLMEEGLFFYSMYMFGLGIGRVHDRVDISEHVYSLDTRRECMLTIVQKAFWYSGLVLPFHTQENLDGCRPGAVMHFQENHLS